MIKKLSILAAIFLIIIVGGLGLAWQKVEQIKTHRLTNANTFDLHIKKGSTLYSITQQLDAYSSIDRISLRLWLKLYPQKSSIQAGLYEVPAAVKFVDLVDMINRGKVKQFSITLLEGHTLKQWLSHLRATEHLHQDLGDKADLYSRLVQATSFCANEHLSLEGCLLPNTYFYSYQDSAFSLLERAYKAMQQTIEMAWSNRFLDIPINSAYEALVLASIVEKETAIDEERGEIAGVFVNRLLKNMRLQTDPTVIYGVGDSYNGDITRKHLRTLTPYNTYMIKGLPITPIAMASKKSILAAVQPAITDAYYFVATGDGGHRFSVTLDEHNKAVRAYLAKQKQQRD